MTARWAPWERWDPVYVRWRHEIPSLVRRRSIRLSFIAIREGVFAYWACGYDRTGLRIIVVALRGGKASFVCLAGFVDIVCWQSDGVIVWEGLLLLLLLLNFALVFRCDTGFGARCYAFTARRRIGKGARDSWAARPSVKIICCFGFCSYESILPELPTTCHILFSTAMTPGNARAVDSEDNRFWRQLADTLKQETTDIQHHVQHCHT